MISKPARGVIHGKTIELAEDLGLREGQELEFCRPPGDAGKMERRRPFSASYAPAQLVPRGI